MTQQDVLLQLENRALSPKEAYRVMYPKQKSHQLRRAHFIKMKVRTNEGKGIDLFLSILFMLPLPMFIVRFAIRRMKSKVTVYDGVQLTPEDLANLVGYRGIKVNVDTHDGVKVRIRTL
ncbi:MAG: hypothetical protein K9K93_07945 [Acholeplasmataceae bacterium]|nr:hypothetical protein [Acholeplasmataceae bacterium]